MTYAEREQIFAKEILSADDIALLFDCDKGAAYKTIRKIRAGSADRLGVEGKCHVQDYMEFFKLPIFDRYGKKLNEKEVDKAIW